MRLLALFVVPLSVSLAALWPRAELPPPDPGPARLEWVRPVVRLQALERGEVRTLALRWRRRGSGPLRLVGVRTGCGCAVATAPTGPLEPGAEGVIDVRLTAGREAGPFVYRMLAYTDAPPPHGLAVCRLVGHVEAPVALRPTALQLGRRSPGGVVKRVVEVRARVAPPEPLTFEWSGLRGVAVAEPPARVDLPGAVLRVTVHVPRTPGPFRGSLAVRGGARVLATLPIRGVVD